MRRIPRRSAVFILLTLVTSLLGVAAPGTANANPTAQFNLLTHSGRAGLIVTVDSGDPCPARPPEFDYQNVVFTFTDSGNVETELGGSVSTNSSGTWNSGTNLTIPWRDVTELNPPTFSHEAATGTATIKARCIRSKSNEEDPMGPPVDMETSQEYVPEAFDVTGPSLGFTMSATTARTGSVLHVTASGCWPSGEVSVSVSGGGYTDTHVDLSPNNGDWSADLTLASVDPMSQEATNFPPGKYAVRATCATSYGMTSLYYGSRVLEVTSIRYVAMGDSYSSGEGVEPFEAGTDTSTNTCHRSSAAYPRLLENELQLDLGSNFVACSGATTAAITLGYNSEGAQIDEVTSGTDLITMTIGGNNMPFEDFATACVTSSCDGTAKTEALTGIVNDVIPRMEYMLGTLRDRLITLNNSDATVLVIGYPQVVTETPWTSPSGSCWWLNNDDEAPAIRQVTQSLNTAIKNEVEAIGYDFHFVPADGANSPFAGHELCRDSLSPEPPFFLNYVPTAPIEYTFHPNTQGQEAYADLIAVYLSQHPLS